MRYASVCSGIEAATVAWHSLGWTPVFFSEIEPFPCAVLAHHYPDVPNYGDMTKFKEWPDATIDVLVGGTPCQSFSVAGLRKGLEDPRGNLMLTYLAIAERYRPQWIVWENVPGVLSSNGGRDFGAFLGALGQLGYGWAYRVLDAQWFGVAQRRRRVFVVANARGWQRAAAVLFESESVRRDSPPSRETGKSIAGTIAARFGRSRNNHEECAPVVAGSLDTQCGGGKLTHQSVANGHIIGTITARMFNALGARDVEEGALLPISFGAQMSLPQTDIDLMQTLQAKNPMAVAQPIAVDVYNQAIDGDTAATLTQACGGTNTSGPKVMHFWKSRRAQSVDDHETWVEDEVTNTINTFDVGDIRATDVIAQPVYGIDAEQNCSEELIGTLRSHQSGGYEGARVAQPICFQQNTRDEVRYINGDGQIAGALAAESGMKQTNYVAQPIAIHPHVIGRAPTSGPQGKEYIDDGSAYCMDARGVPQSVAQPATIAWDEELNARVEQAGTILRGGQGGRNDGVMQPVAFAQNQPGEVRVGKVTNTLNTNSNASGRNTPMVAQTMQVRRLTPVECERLQGFLDGYTNIPWRKKPESPDGPRYKALGNSMAVPVMRWIGERIAMLDPRNDEPPRGG